MFQRAKKPGGFTLIELLVVIAIIGMLMTMTVPAVNKVRELAARSQCQNNLRNIGQATITYDSNFNTLPHALTCSSWWGGSDPSTQTIWFQLLPYIEMGSIYNAGNSRQDSWGGSVPGTPTGQVLSYTVRLYLCPSDATQSNGFPAYNNNNWATTSYGYNFQLFGGNRGPTNIMWNWSPKWNGSSWPWSWTLEKGYAAKSQFSIGNIPDGSSNTLLYSEVFAFCGNNVTNSPPWGRSTWTYPWWWDRQMTHPIGIFGGWDSPPQTGIAQGSGDYNRSQSFHTGGVLCVMGDGSTRVLSNVSQSNWQRAVTPSDNLPLINW